MEHVVVELLPAIDRTQGLKKIDRISKRLVDTDYLAEKPFLKNGATSCIGKLEFFAFEKNNYLDKGALKMLKVFSKTSNRRLIVSLKYEILRHGF